MALLRCSKKGLGAVLMQREKEGPRTTKGSGLSEGHYGLGFPTQILRAQTEARKQKTSRRRMLEVWTLQDSYESAGSTGKETDGAILFESNLFLVERSSLDDGVAA
ncbi:hypothetical protein Tco_0522259 [Tanacetum coccineum]